MVAHFHWNPVKEMIEDIDILPDDVEVPETENKFPQPDHAGIHQQGL